MSHSTLSFSWTAEYPSDTLYFAMCYPYTYTDLRAYLARIQADPLRARHVRRQRLALTIAGNECEMLWVTDHASPAGPSTLGQSSPSRRVCIRASPTPLG